MPTQHTITELTYFHNILVIDDEFDGSEFNHDMEVVLHDITTVTFSHEAFDL